MAKSHILKLMEDGSVICTECRERQEVSSKANPKLSRPCEGYQGDSQGAKLSKYKAGKEEYYKKYPMMRSYKKPEDAERARFILYGDGPYPDEWRLPLDEKDYEGHKK